MIQLPYDADPPCEVCGLFPEECICPPCKVCGQHGRPLCYEHPNDLGHGMEKNAAQQIEHQKYRVAEAKAAWQDECQVLDYLEEQANRQGD